MNAQEENINPYADLTDADLNERILELNNELRELRHEAKHRQTAVVREAWENLQEAQASYRDVVGGNIQRTYVQTRPFGSINYGRIRL
jgi:ribosomal protein L29